MRFTLTLECNGAAFDGARGRELETARILRELAHTLEHLGTDAGTRIRDVNGNTVGRFGFEAEPHDGREG